LRELTRYRADLVGVRTAERNRVEKLLEDALIKLSVVASAEPGADAPRNGSADAAATGDEPSRSIAAVDARGSGATK
jgi:transposase